MKNDNIIGGIMKNILVTLLVGFLLISCGKNEVDLKTLQQRNEIYYEINKSSPFNGKVKEYYPNGKIKIEGTIKDGKFDGEYKTYYPNGKLNAFSKRKKFKLYSYERYFENGQLNTKGFFNNNDKLTGLFESYFENGQNKIKINFDKNGNIIDKEIIMYHKNGHIKLLAKTENGELNGPYESFYTNGNKSFSCFVKGNNFNGNFLMFDNKNNLIYEGTYLDNKLNGILKIYKKNELENELSFVNGKLNGKSKLFINDSSKFEEVDFLDDVAQNIINRIILLKINYDTVLIKLEVTKIFTNNLYNIEYIKNPFALELFGHILYPTLNEDEDKK